MSPRQKFKRHTISFYHAFSGIKYALLSQPNFQIHLSIALAVIVFGILLDIHQTEWLILTFTIFLVLIAEMLNTSIESMVDLITKEYHQQAKIAKDVASGMVLLSAIAAVIVGLLIFVPYLL